MRTPGRTVITILAVSLAGTALAAELVVEPAEVTVGARIQATLTFDLPDGATFEPPQIGPDLGPFQVFDGRWTAPAEDHPTRWVWRGQFAAFETGELAVPAIPLRIVGEDGATVVETDEVAVRIVTVLSDDADLAGLKDTASLIADHGPLLLGLGSALGLLALAGLAWWIHRRYARRFEAVAMPEDVFRRLPPHEWVYDELKRLLDARLLEQGQFERFYEELARIMKRYAGGRFRIDLMERTSEEVPAALRQAGAAENAVLSVSTLLREADAIKFAASVPDPARCRAAVERAYGIVDATRPAEEPAEDRAVGAG